MLIEEAEFVVFDVETTGLNPQAGDRICEIGAVKVSRREIVSSFTKLVNPKRDVPLEALSIHGIDLEELKKAPLFEEVIDNFLEFIDGFFLLGYNIEFDLSFLNIELQRIGKKPLENPYIDILGICRRFLTLEKYNLSSVAQFFKLPLENLHRAYQDALTSAHIFLNLSSYLERGGIRNMEELSVLFGSKKEDFSISNPKIEIIQKALRESLKLKIKYYSFYKKELTEREVLPYSLDLRGAKYFLVGQCLLRGEERSFNLDNIIDLEVI